MSRDTYAARQSARDAQYARDYAAWIKSLPDDERRKVEDMGLGTPSLSKFGNGAPERDMAESPRASHTPDIAAMADHDEPAKSRNWHDTEEVLRVLVADLLAEGNTRLTIECLAVAIGLSAYDGRSMTEIAHRHGVTRAAVSKRCVDITERLSLEPSRAMRSKEARKKYSAAKLKATPSDVRSFFA